MLDRHSQQVGADRLERRIQLRASEWMKRLWTFQEGRLASELYIQVKDEAVSINELLGDGSDNPDQWTMHIFSRLDESSKTILGSAFTGHKERKNRLIDFIEELAFRNVTIATDEPICLATFLGLDLEPIGNNLTMMDIYRSPDDLPQQLLFAPGPRLDASGFGWAPSTFMHRTDRFSSRQ